jgi:hypothetical protein
MAFMALWAKLLYSESSTSGASFFSTFIGALFFSLFYFDLACTKALGFFFTMGGAGASLSSSSSFSSVLVSY